MIVDNPQHFQVLAFQSDINKIFTQDICTEHYVVFCYFESVYDRNEVKFLYVLQECHISHLMPFGNLL